MKQKLEYTDILVVIDTREQRPLDLSPLRTTRGTLATADYTIYGLEKSVAYERKSLQDFVACCYGDNRVRFEKELQRLLAYQNRGVLIEASMIDLMAGHWRSKISASTVVTSYYAWANRGIPIYLTGSRDGAVTALRKLLYDAAKKRWEEGYRFWMSTAEAQEKAMESRRKKVNSP